LTGGRYIPIGGDMNTYQRIQAKREAKELLDEIEDEELTLSQIVDKAVKASRHPREALSLSFGEE